MAVRHCVEKPVASGVSVAPLTPLIKDLLLRLPFGFAPSERFKAPTRGIERRY